MSKERYVTSKMWISIESYVIVKDNHLLQVKYYIWPIKKVRQIIQVFLNFTVTDLPQEEEFVQQCFCYVDFLETEGKRHQSRYLRSD